MRGTSFIAAVAAVLAVPCAAQTAQPPASFTAPAAGYCIACHQLPEGVGPRTRADLGPALSGDALAKLVAETLGVSPDTAAQVRKARGD